MLSTYTSPLVTAQVDGPTLTNSAVLTSILPAQAKFTLPANFLQFIGQELIIEASGRISTLAATPGTLLFVVRAGATNITATPTFALNVNAKTAVTWWLRWDLTVRSVGSAASVMNTGFWTSEAVIGSPTPAVGGSGTLLIPPTAPAAGTTFDSTVSNIIDLRAQWSVADPANQLTLHQYRLYSTN